MTRYVYYEFNGHYFEEEQQFVAGQGWVTTNIDELDEETWKGVKNHD